ncbi:MAG: UDP-glucose/GDP-mannose dehydrogenase family protein [Alphaproteobacteria bacterium]|nr:UDP-glucose/GDP-mannose dehydrogenase family protein [Alphaproteobacteria bacterium]
MKIAIIGTGYVGLPSGVGFAELGHDVICVDKDASKIERLRKGRITLFEQGLEDLFLKNLKTGRLNFTTDIRSISDSDVVMIAVGTPPHPETGHADMKYIHAAARDIAPYLKNAAVVANKSTVPVGTGDDVERIISLANPKAKFHVISLPEFLREGFAVHDFFNPDRVVVGANASRGKKLMQELYDSFPKPQEILFTDRRSSEMIKYASNAFLAVKIHYANEMQTLCAKVGANIYDVTKGMGMDSRIGAKFLNPGPGYGGSCFPKDTLALVNTADSVGVNMSLVNAAVKGNDNRQIEMAHKILDTVKHVQYPNIGVWGLAFKAGTDDARESPAVRIVQEIKKQRPQVSIRVHDPKAMKEAYQILGNHITYTLTPYDAAFNTDVLAVLTEWKEFSEVSLDRLQMREKRIVDLRNIVDANYAIENGFEYIGLQYRKISR